MIFCNQVKKASRKKDIPYKTKKSLSKLETLIEEDVPLGKHRGKRRDRGHEVEIRGDNLIALPAIKPREDFKNYKVSVTAKTENQRKYIQAILNSDIIFCHGSAGTGKTTVAAGIALQLLLEQNSPYEKIVIIRPAKEACGENLGALPGDLSEKMLPWALPVLDNCLNFIDKKILNLLIEQDKIEVIPIAYARGRSLNNCLIIIDEAENLTDKMLLLLLTRFGQGSKMVINGDLEQSDIHNSGFNDAMHRLAQLDGVSIIMMTDEDVVRHPLVKEILKLYRKTNIDNNEF